MGKSKMRQNRSGRWCVERQNGQLRNPGKYIYFYGGHGPYPTLTELCNVWGFNYFTVRSSTNSGWPKCFKLTMIEKKENNGTTED